LAVPLDITEKTPGTEEGVKPASFTPSSVTPQTFFFLRTFFPEDSGSERFEAR
jgi:hypothetical protein